MHKHSGFAFINLLPFIIISIVLAALLLLQSFYIVEPGFSAVHLRLGRIIKTQTLEGFYVKMPFIDSITRFDMRIQRAEIETKALSKDLQTVSVGMVVNYRIEGAAGIFKNIGRDFEKIIIDPFVQESVKAIVAKFDAESLIQKRHEAKDMVVSELIQRLGSKQITLVDFNFTHLDFSPEFIHAVEAKQIAEQDAKRAENMTKQVREEALQIRARAEAEAFSLKVKRESITPELTKLKMVEAQVKAIEKWDGHLPQVTSGAVPFLPMTQGETPVKLFA
jgi:prohibitin 2